MMAEESARYEMNAHRGQRQAHLNREVASGRRRTRTFCAPSSRAVLLAHRASDSWAQLSDEDLVAHYRSCKQRVDRAKRELQGVPPKAAAVMKELLETALYDSVQAFQLVTEEVNSPARQGLNPFDTNKWARVWAA